MNPHALHPADQQAFDRMAAVRPQLLDLRPAHEAFDFPPGLLLHAGPPYRPGQRPPAPVRNSAAAACVFEGWATDLTAAHALINTGDVRLAAAQDHGCVVPLAAVLSRSQQVQVVRDAGGAGAAVHAALNGGSGQALRLGLPGDAVVAHLRWLNGALADALRPALQAGPIELLPLADLALQQGDDCHGRTQAGTAALLAHWPLAADAPARVHDFLAASPSFFLNLWMAASRCILQAAEGIAHSEVVTSMGSNGIEAGVRLAARPGTWQRAEATVPVGPPVDAPLPAIGDSAVVEALGLGAMAMALAPAQQAALGAFMPLPAAALAEALLQAPHPGLPLSGARFGLSARRVRETGLAPVVALGILDATGQRGRLAGGVWQAPASLFDALP